MENQFVIYPHDEKDNFEIGLTPQDKLIYLAIRRYMNKITLTSFPSYATITKDIGAASKTIKKSVNNLVREGYLETKRDGRKIIYKFNNKKKFEMYSYDFLDKKDLTFTEKAYIVASQQYMFKDGYNEEGRISLKNKELSKLIKMSESAISKCNHSLEEKHYLKGASEPIKRFQLRELDQLFICTLIDHENRLNDQNAKIDKLEQEVKMLKQKLEEKQENMQLTDKQFIV